MIWVRLCGRVLSRHQVGLRAELSSSSRWSLWVRPQVRSWTQGWCETLTHLSVCRCTEMNVFFPDFNEMSLLAHNIPIFIPKNVPWISVTFQRCWQLEPSVVSLVSLLSLSVSVSSKMAVLAKRSSGPQDTKTSPITLLVMFPWRQAEPWHFPPHEWLEIQWSNPGSFWFEVL